MHIGHLLLLLLLLPRCAEPHDTSEITRSRFLMGTNLTITVARHPAGDEPIEAAFEEVARIESQISTWRDDSTFAEINATPVGTPRKLDEETFDLLASAIDWSRRTGSAFDPASGRILFAWDLRGNGGVPASEDLSLAREHSGAQYLRLDRDHLTVTREEDLLLEEGGFGKGYALDRAVSVLERSGVERAILDFGGQVSLIGDAPVTVGIAHPRHRQKPAVEIGVTRGSIATSSGSESTFEVQGRRFSHIFDPRTGIPLPPRGSVTVVHESGLAADILATALYVMGPDEGRAWADRHGIAAIFIVPGPKTTWRVLPSTETIRSIVLEAIDPNFNIERNDEL